jgi:hypothetical protein
VELSYGAAILRSERDVDGGAWPPFADPQLGRTLGAEASGFAGGVLRLHAVAERLQRSRVKLPALFEAFHFQLHVIDHGILRLSVFGRELGFIRLS